MFTSTSRPSSSSITTPSSAHCGSIAASSSDSIPLLLRGPQPTPPDSPSSTIFPSGPPAHGSLDKKKRTPSVSNLRNFSFSKLATRSSPSLANLAKAHRQQPPPTPSDLCGRPLPPLPTQPSSPHREPERSPSPPPNISVFETDTDEDSDSDARKSLARRFVAGLVHHHHHSGSGGGTDRGQKSHSHPQGGAGAVADHKRSQSDEGPSSLSSSSNNMNKEMGSKNGGGGMGISKTLGATGRQRRVETVSSGEAVSLGRGAVSMDLPRNSGYSQQQEQEQQQQDGRGEKGGVRFWRGILKRRG
ncbi:hypothetical protein VTI74DRAFT_7867 [Chaetomium olivicolor]